MELSHKKLALGGALLAAVLLVIVLVVASRQGARDELTVNQPAERQRGGAGVEADPGYVIVGGVRRKRSDIQAKPNVKSKESSPHSGGLPAIKVDANPNIESIVEAVKTGKHPERLSPLAKPTPFDPEAFTADPDAYLKVVEPGRVFQTAQPGPNVPVLIQDSPRIHRLVEGESARLRVRAAPKSPVSFTSFGGGQFQNQTNAITVRANDRGIGEVKFFASPGAVGNIEILAGSPTSTGQIRFLMRVELPAEETAGPVEQTN